MKPRVSRDSIISATIDLITRHGIRAVRVDEISASLGISKRTLYETFRDKTELVVASIEEIGRRQQLVYVEYLKQHSGDEESLANLFWIITRLVESLYAVDTSYLSEVRRRLEYQPVFLAGREFWLTHVDQFLRKCTEQGLLERRFGDFPLAHRLLVSLYSYRLDDVTIDELLTYSCIFIRGMATAKGIAWIDGNDHLFSRSGAE